MALLAAVLGLLTGVGVLRTETQTPEQLGRAYWEKRTNAARQALLQYAAAHSRDANGGLAWLALGLTDLERGQNEDAVRHFEQAKKRLPPLGDHIAYGLGRALVGAGRKQEALAEFQSVVSFRPASIHAGYAALLAARILVETDSPREALAMLESQPARVPQPEGLALKAAALEALPDLRAAAVEHQRIFHEFPTSEAAGKSAASLRSLERRLGDAFPPAMPQMILGRASKLVESGQAARAIRELESHIPRLGGVHGDAARVQIGVARYQARDNRAALQHLKGLGVPEGEQDAERWYYVLACARRLELESEMESALARLNERYPQSRWRLEGLVASGNHYLLRNKADGFVPAYRACFESFPNDAQAEGCHWKVVWEAYIHRRGNRMELLMDHLKRFPDSSKAGAANYFLGRAMEEAGRAGGSKGYYVAAQAAFPNSYYALLARERLGGANSAADRHAAAGRQPAERGLRPVVDGPTQTRLERAKLLESAGLDLQAEGELQFGGKTDSNPHAVAIELARMARVRGDFGKSIRYIKAFANGYLGWTLAEAPEEFWRLAFPIPFRQELEKHGVDQALDLYLMAGLVRQESEFDPKAVSPVKALGLTQIRPATGRELSRKLGIRRFKTSMLFQPDVNLRMGTYYLRRLLDEFGGRWEAALAAYNAGRSRASEWLQWADYREPAEFVENIPFSETRNYVQTVLRNADIYRRLYAGKPAAATSTRGPLE